MKQEIYRVSFWKRLIAYLADLVVINIVIVIPFNFLFEGDLNIKELNILISNDITKLYVIILAGIFIAVLSIAYWALFEYFLSQSLGKMLMRIKVISIKGRLRFSQCLLRNITKISSLLLLFDCLYMLNGNGLRYLDKISKTKVIETWQGRY